MDKSKYDPNGQLKNGLFKEFVESPDRHFERPLFVLATFILFLAIADRSVGATLTAHWIGTADGKWSAPSNLDSSVTIEPQFRNNGLLSIYAREVVFKGPFFQNAGRMELFGTTIPKPAIIIGTGNVAQANTIFANGGAGVNLLGANILFGNSIFNNAGLGIDRGGDGPTANTPGGPSNFPVLTSATQGSTKITGTFNGSPDCMYSIQFFSNPPSRSQQRNSTG